MLISILSRKTALFSTSRFFVIMSGRISLRSLSPLVRTMSTGTVQYFKLHNISACNIKKESKAQRPLIDILTKQNCIKEKERGVHHTTYDVYVHNYTTLLYVCAVFCNFDSPLR